MDGDSYYEDEDWSDEDWHEDDSVTDVVPCPECGADVYEDADQCPSCGHYILPDTSPWSGKPLLWVVLGLAGIAAVIGALAGW